MLGGGLDGEGVRRGLGLDDGIGEKERGRDGKRDNREGGFVRRGECLMLGLARGFGLLILRMNMRIRGGWWWE